MKFLLVVVLVAAVHGAPSENCHMQRLVDCGNPLSDFRKQMGQSFPTSEDQVKQLCGEMEKAYKCAEEYQNKCMTPLQLETLGFLVEGSETAYKEFCTEGSTVRTDYLKNAECIDAGFKTDEAKNQYTYVEAALEDLSEKPAPKRLSTACCGYDYLNTKSLAMLKDRCGEAAVNSFKSVVEMAVSSLPTVFCSGFHHESDQCKEVLPPPGTQPKGTLKNSHIAQSFAAIYLPDVKTN